MLYHIIDNDLDVIVTDIDIPEMAYGQVKDYIRENPGNILLPASDDPQIAAASWRLLKAAGIDY